MNTKIAPAADTSPTRRDALRIEQAMRAEIANGAPLPQWTTNHYWAGGMYGREMHHPAGMVVVGKVHKKESLFILTHGSIRVLLDDGVVDLSAPHVITTKPGTKRVVYSELGATYMTVHRTNRKTVEAVERETVEDDPLAAYDGLNLPAVWKEGPK